MFVGVCVTQTARERESVCACVCVCVRVKVCVCVSLFLTHTHKEGECVCMWGGARCDQCKNSQTCGRLDGLCWISELKQKFSKRYRNSRALVLQGLGMFGLWFYNPWLCVITRLLHTLKQAVVVKLLMYHCNVIAKHT